MMTRSYIIIASCVVVLLFGINIFTGYLLAKTIFNNDDQTIAIIVGYFAVENYCPFNQWAGGAYVKFVVGNNTCVSPIIFDETCSELKNQTIELVKKLHPPNSIISGGYNNCDIRPPKGIIWVRAVLFSFTVLLTVSVIAFIIVKYRRHRTVLQAQTQIQRDIIYEHLVSDL